MRKLYCWVAVDSFGVKRTKMLRTSAEIAKFEPSTSRRNYLSIYQTKASDCFRCGNVLYANFNFLLIINAFSKYVELVQLFDQWSHSIIEALGLVWTYRQGPPELMTSDQGSFVDGSVFRNFPGLFCFRKISLCITRRQTGRQRLV